MKKFLSLLAVLICWQFYLYGQGRDNIFIVSYYGSYNREFINFHSGSPVVAINNNMGLFMNRTNANICDLNGNLLFFTNGSTICSGNQDTMFNGIGLNPCQYTSSWIYQGLRITQANLILPNPGNSAKYYLLHETLELYPNLSWRPLNLYSSQIDMSLQGGAGEVIQKNISVLQDTLGGGQLTACKHANGRDWWIIAPEFGHPAYYVLLLIPAGISVQSKQTIGTHYYEGQAAFSPDGTKYGSYSTDDHLQLFDFDRCTGILSNARQVSINDSMMAIGGFSFSPNSKFVYMSSGIYLYQVNTDSVNLNTSFNTVAVWDGFVDFSPTTFDAQQLAPDGKIYIVSAGTNRYMHVINSPDSSGIAANVTQHSLYLGDSTFNWNSIPNHPNYFLGPVLGSVCDSLGLGIDDNVYTKNLNLRINPNPAQSSFYLNYELPTGKDAMLYVYNTLGKQVYKQQLFSVNKYLLVHCDAWQQGMYYLKVVMRDDKYSANAKVVICR